MAAKHASVRTGFTAAAALAGARPDVRLHLRVRLRADRSAGTPMDDSLFPLTSPPSWPSIKRPSSSC